MSLELPEALEGRIDRLIGKYPQKRSASLMVLHLLQDHLGWLPKEAVEWTARKLDLEPIHVHELVTFYPMFRESPAGDRVIKVCRTLSCALAGGGEVRRRLCERLGLDPGVHHLQTTGDGRFSVESVECLAACGTAPALLRDEELFEKVDPGSLDRILEDGRVAAGHGFEP